MHRSLSVIVLAHSILCASVKALAHVARATIFEKISFTIFFLKLKLSWTAARREITPACFVTAFRSKRALAVSPWTSHCAFVAAGPNIASKTSASPLKRARAILPT